MPAICHLTSLRRAIAGTAGISPPSISGHDLYPSVCFEPALQGLGLTVWQEVNHTMLLQIDKNGAVALTFAKGKVIDAKDTCHVCLRQQGGSCTSEQRI